MKKSSQPGKWKFYAGILTIVATSAVGSLGIKGQTAVIPTSKQQLLQSSHAFNEIAQKALPAVVSISVVKRNDALESEEEGMIPGAPPFMRPGEPHSHPPIHEGLPDSGGGAGRSVGIGSGAIIRSDGLILTNHHVVENSERITVTLDEKHKRTARVVGTDSKTDLALIKMDPAKGQEGRVQFPVLEFGDSDSIAVGDWVVAVGSPFGLNRTVTSGIVSAKSRAQMGILDIEDFIQTDAPINPGSSGGPLLNMDGKIIGLNTAIFSQGGGFVGIGFAIPSRIVKDVADQLAANGRVTRGYIGLSAQDLDPALAKYFKAPQSARGEQMGALISDVMPKGPANKASIKAGDVILKYNDQDIANATQFKSLVGKTRAGKNVNVELLRSGRKEVKKVEIALQPGDKVPSIQQAGQAAHSPTPPSLGLAVEDVPIEISHFLSMPEERGALVIGVSPGSLAFDSGLIPGDIILKAGQTEIIGAKQFKRVAKEISKSNDNGDLTVFYVQRGPDEKVFVPLKNES